MTSETPEPVYSRATQAPWREIVRQRWSGRLDRALVLHAQDGAYSELRSRNRRGSRSETYADTYSDAHTDTYTETYPDPVAVARSAVRPKLLGRYDDAFIVRLEEQTGTQGVALPTRYGAESVDVQVLWWVRDPVQVVRTRTKTGWDAVRRDLRRRLRHLEDQYSSAGQGLGATELMRHLSTPQTLLECGLAYHVTDVRGREEDSELRLGQTGEADAPYSWTPDRREEYEFCMQAVSKGPASLAALWLLRHPDQVSQVLDWSVGHADLLRGETTWQDGMAGLLGSLSEQERQELSELLRDRLVRLGRRVPAQPPREAPAGQRGVANGHPR
ncbi:hypothetical protein [Streptomyces paludis]|uniref:Uncharacterized protein n=1 Tax=Streptomyces paludis TaxID=2282738 RepID=A0A345HQY9_9ACTN|nr:hypothetical protein [Streptomyces paludis]AXG79113.1 hypothetical protein DVK44_17100 [Streptomyces paludis]